LSVRGAIEVLAAQGDNADPTLLFTQQQSLCRHVDDLQTFSCPKRRICIDFLPAMPPTFLHFARRTSPSTSHSPHAPCSTRTPTNSAAPLHPSLPLKRGGSSVRGTATAANTSSVPSPAPSVNGSLSRRSPPPQTSSVMSATLQPLQDVDPTRMCHVTCACPDQMALAFMTCVCPCTSFAF
jgi:hypothetical protein